MAQPVAEYEETMQYYKPAGDLSVGDCMPFLSCAPLRLCARKPVGCGQRLLQESCGSRGSSVCGKVACCSAQRAVRRTGWARAMRGIGNPRTAIEQ